MVRKFFSDWFGVYFQRRLITMALFGFSCGIPYFLTASTLTVWLKELSVDYTTIGFFAIATLPYSLRFLWAPLIDRLPIPLMTRWFGRRRAWFLLSQLGLMACLVSFSIVGPEMWLALLTTFCAATQETVFLTYQMETLQKTQYGPGDAIGVMGARVGMLVGGAGALYLSSYMPWESVYAVMSLFVVVGIIVTLRIDEPNPIINKETIEQEKKISDYLHAHPKLNKPVATTLSWLHAAVICPFAEFMTRQGWLAALGIMFFYKLGDNIIGTMPNVMYLEIGFSKEQIADATKLFGMLTSILGGLIAGIMITRLGFLKSMLYFGLLHMLATFMYIVTYNAGNDLSILYFAVALEHFTAGMRTAALFAYQLTLSNPVYAATQLALLTSLVNSGRTVFSSLSGWAVLELGWVNFYLVATTASALPLLICLYLMYINQESIFKKPALQIS